MQVGQWWSLTELMKPNSPRNPGTLKVRAGPAVAGAVTASRGPSPARRRRISAMGRKWRRQARLIHRGHEFDEAHLEGVVLGQAGEVQEFVVV